MSMNGQKYVTIDSPVGDISVIRTDTTLDHSPEAAAPIQIARVTLAIKIDGSGAMNAVEPKRPVPQLNPACGTHTSVP